MAACCASNPSRPTKSGFRILSSPVCPTLAEFGVFFRGATKLKSTARRPPAISPVAAVYDRRQTYAEEAALALENAAVIDLVITHIF